MVYFNSIKSATSLLMDDYLPVEQYGEIKNLTSDVNYVAAVFAKEGSFVEEKTMCFWDLFTGGAPNKKKYMTKFYSGLVMQNHSDGCFFTDKTLTGSVLGYINSQTCHTQEIPYTGMPDLSVEKEKGATVGKNGKTCKLLFWDLVTMQDVSSIRMDFQQRNLCAMVPSESNLAVTLQSGTTFEKPNVISLWDSRIGKKVIKEKKIHENKDIYSMAVLQTSRGPRIITRSVDSSAIDFRSIFDEAFGEPVECFNVPAGSGVYPHSRSDLTFLNSKGSILNTCRNHQAPTSEYSQYGCPTTAKQVTFRSYDLKNIQEDTLKPEIVIEFPPVDINEKENPEYSFACDSEKVVIAAVSSNTHTKQIGIFKPK